MKPYFHLSPIVVGIEGAKGALNFYPYRSFPDPDVTTRAAKHLLEQSFITGAEYAGITIGLADPQGRPNRNPPALFWGVEDEPLYLGHLRAFKQSIQDQKTALEIHRKLSEKLEAILSQTQVKNFHRPVAERVRDAVLATLQQ